MVRKRCAPLGVVRQHPEIFCWELDHADVLLGLVVTEWDLEVVGEAQHIGLMALEAQQQVVRLGLSGGRDGMLFVAHVDHGSIACGEFPGQRGR